MIVEGRSIPRAICKDTTSDRTLTIQRSRHPTPLLGIREGINSTYRRAGKIDEAITQSIPRLASFAISP